MAISHYNGIAVSTISHFNGIAKANVSALDGVTASFGGGGGGTTMPVFRFIGTQASGDASGPTVNFSSTNADDIILLFVESNNEAVSAPDGTWTEAPDSPISNAGTNPTRLTVFWKRSPGSETSVSVADSGDHTTAQVIVFQDVIASGNPFDVTTQATGTGTAVTVPGDTTTGANRLIVIGVVSSRDSTSTTNFSSWANTDLSSVTERNDRGSDLGTGGCLGIATGTKAVAGAYGNSTVTISTNIDWAGWTGALIGE